MLGRLLTIRNTDNARPTWTLPAMSLMLMTVPLAVSATPSNMGSFTITSQNVATGAVSGNYTAARIDSSVGATGTFSITRRETNGYNGVEFTDGANGLMILNKLKQGTTADDNDKFAYTMTLTPINDLSMHTIKIGQASYAPNGNSEIARQTLSYTANPDIPITALATIKENPSVTYFFGAMGDYFMGRKLAGNSFSSNNTISAPQLRVDSSNGGDSGLYYYNITALNGSGTSSSFTPTTTGSGSSAQVSFASGQKKAPYRLPQLLLTFSKPPLPTQTIRTPIMR